MSDGDVKENSGCEEEEITPLFASLLGTENDKNTSEPVKEVKPIINSTVKQVISPESDTTTEQQQEQPQGENQHRARKAQKTKARVKINVPVKSDESSNQNNMSPPQQQQQQDVRKRQKHQPEPVSQDDDDEEDLQDEDDDEYEPSRLATAITTFFMAIYSFFANMFGFCLKCLKTLFRCCWRFVCFIAPLLIGLPLYAAVLYLSAEYLVTQMEPATKADMNCRLNYIFRCHAFTMMPVLLGLVVSTNRIGSCHAEFYKESLQQSVLFIINSIILVSHCDLQLLHWVPCIVIAYVTFSVPYWISLAYGGSKLQSTLASPILLTNIALMGYNLTILSGQYFGYFLAEADFEDPKESAVHIGTQTHDEVNPMLNLYSWLYLLIPTGFVSFFYQNQQLFG